MEHHFHIGGWQCFQQEKKEDVKSWILMDRKSTIDIFGKSKYLTNIKIVSTTLKLMGNGGLLTSNQQVNLKIYGNLWYNPKAIGNILSLSNVKKKNTIIYNSENGEILIVINTIPGGQDMIFTANKDMRYYKYMSNTKGFLFSVTWSKI